MELFESAEQFKEVEVAFLEKLMDDPDFGPMFASMKMNLKYNIKDIDQELWLIYNDCARGEVIWGPANETPTIELTLSADHFHMFWAKTMSVTAALAKGDVSMKGPIQKILKLVSKLKPAYAIYADHIKSMGLSHLEKA